MKSNGSLLSALNPSAKLFSHLLVMCILMFVSNPKPTFSFGCLRLSSGFFRGWTLSYLSKRLLPYLIFYSRILDDGRFWERRGNDLGMGLVPRYRGKRRQWADNRAADARLCHIRSLVYVNNRFDAVYYEPDSSMQIVA